MYNGQTPSRKRDEYWNGNIRWLSSGELNRGIVYSSIETITEEGKKSANLRVVPKGTFVMAITGLEASGTRGNCALLGFDTTLNQSCMALFPKQDILISQFLFQWYRMVGEEYGINYTQGTKQQSYNAELIKILPILLPSIDEQKKIASYLNSIDHLITLHQRKNIYFYEKVTLVWEQRKLEDIMDTVTDYVAAGSFEDIRNNVTYLNEPGYAQLVRTVDLKKKFTNNDSIYVDESAFKYLWRVNLNEECIVLPNIGANIGEVYFVEPSGLPYDNNVLGPNAILLKANEDTYFAFTALNNLTFQKQLFENVGSSGQPKFNKTELKSIQLYMPQNEEQEKIGQYFRDLDHLITLHQCKCHLLHKLLHNDWEQRKLGEIAFSFEYGLNAAAKEYDGENKYIRITDIDNNTHEFLTYNLTSPDIDLTDAENYKLAEGDILLARTGASVGKSYIYRDSDGLVYYAGFLIRARIREEYDAEFVFQSTLTDKYNKYIQNILS